MGNVAKDLVQDIDFTDFHESFASDPYHCSSLIQKPSSNLKIFLQNIRSINCDYNFSGLLAILSQTNLDTDILILTECRLSSQPMVPYLDGYQSYSSNKTNVLQNDGVVFYVKNNITNTIIEEPEFADANCLILKIGKDTAIVAIYRSPSYKNTANFLTSLGRILGELTSYKNVLVIGDINIDIKKGNEDRNSPEYLTLAAYLGYFPTHLLPTRYENCLDHILAKTVLPVKTVVLNTSLTDHRTLLICLQQGINRSYAISTQKKLNEKAVSRNLENLDMSPFYNCLDPNTIAKYLTSSLSQIIETNTQITFLSRRKKIIKPWITPGLLRCIRNRDKLHQTMNRFPNNVTHKTTYYRYRNFCNSLLRKLKRQYEMIQIQNAGQDKKRLWQVIKNIANMANTKSPAIELIANSSQALQSANSANSFFVNIGKTLAKNIIMQPNDLNTNASNQTHTSQLHSFALLPTDETEVKSIIMTLRNGCATGIDNISCSFIKKYMKYLTPHLTYLFNLCLSTGIFPKVFKTALIKPIHKNGDKSCVNNYRPIAILPSLSKILERIIYKRLVLYLESNNLLATAQYGFRSSRSTSDAVNQLTDYIIRQMDSQKKCLAIFLDLAKAFDTVNIPILLSKLENLGIRGQQLTLFKDYLSDRTQRVQIDRIISDELPIEYGVPQGSILGPVLFLVYINDLLLSPLSNGSRIISYADDTALLFSANNWDDVFSQSQSGFNYVMNWLRVNALTLNTEKTQYMTFSYNSSTQPTDGELSISAHIWSCLNHAACNCPKLKSTSTITYLGVIIDRHLKFNSHVEALTSRVRKLIYVFKNLRHVANSALLKSVYLSLCQSLLMYCITSWGGTHKTTMIDLERAQRAILKVSTFRPFRYPTRQLLAECDVLSVRQLFILQTIIQKHSQTPYDSSHQKRHRRADIVCRSELFHTEHTHRFFCFLGPYLYNNLNLHLQIYPMTKIKCKIAVQTWLKSKTYEETEELLTVIK